MDSKEILAQYIQGSLKSKAAIAALELLLSETSSLSGIREAARARYVISFIRRVWQYNAEKISGKDLCLNIRELALVLGRITLTPRLQEVVKTYGEEFDLTCERGFQVSGLLRGPSWLEHQTYVDEVYALGREAQDPELHSAGDALLRNHTVFRSYKSFEQKLAVHTAVCLPIGHTLLISQPTGGGKSLVTQVLASVSQGLTVVIVPTVALAMDQYYAAKRNLTNCGEVHFYRGEQADKEREALMAALRTQKARLLLTSPEAVFKNQAFCQLLDKAAKEGYITNVIIDEAHVVPDWGVFFRPDFQIFSVALAKWRRLSEGRIRTFLLSATLSDEVVETLLTLFGNDNHNAQLRFDALRQEPRFYFHAVKSKIEQNRKAVEAIKLLPKPMVCYVLEPREAKDLQKHLKQEGFFNVPIFTGETTATRREEVLTGWKDYEFDVVIATSAFGIGVDKPDVRSIIHACCPENLSRFYQEVGRGGRDRLPSLSLFIPNQSQSGDVRRAFGLVSKSVLTVERLLPRWRGLLASQGTLIGKEECVFDTKATPLNWTQEQTEVAGQQNMSWNINLLLLLHRTGFVNITDASYDIQQRAYTVTARLLKPDILGDDERLAEALASPRKKESDASIRGYHAIQGLVESPRSMCWGRIFRGLFPLARECCNGCPAHVEGRGGVDEDFKLRLSPGLRIEPAPSSPRLRRHMSTYMELIVQRKRTGPCIAEEIIELSERANRCELGAIVLPRRLAEAIAFNGLVLCYEEFIFIADKCPYLLAKGVLCVLENDSCMNLTLYKHLQMLKEYGYHTVLFCNESVIVSADGKSVRECADGYPIDLDKL